MPSIACNVVLLPEPEVAKWAISLSQHLAPRGVFFTLADGSFFPHVSIYMLQLKVDDLPEVENRLRKIATTQRPFNLSAARYWQAKQFLDAEYEKTQAVNDLQRTVIAALDPIRDGMRDKDIERMQTATGLALENFKNYGWNTVGELYRSHLTITRFIENQDIDGLRLPPVQKFNGDFLKLGLFEMGDNGTCARKIVEFNLQAALVQ